MSEYIKYFQNGGKNMSFKINDDCALVKYNEIWNKIKKTLDIKFHNMSVYDKEYIKAKVRELNRVIKVPIEGVHYACIVCIIIDSLMK